MYNKYGGPPGGGGGGSPGPGVGGKTNDTFYILKVHEV